MQRDMIRFAAAEDLEKIAALYVRNHKSAYRGLLSDAYLSALTEETAAEKWAAFLRSPENRIWVAYEGDRFLGFAAGMPDAELEETWYLESLHVAGDARGRGVGTALIRAAAQYAREHGCRRMSVCIVRGNDRAAVLYKKLGAAHYACFTDDFGGTPSDSEKLLWERLPTGQ